MPKWLIKLTPLGPYFFGGERIFEKEDGNKYYFIRSLETPSQTTLFGALRYIGIKEPSSNYALSEDDKKNIGERSYRLNSKGNGEKKEEFGRIKGISPLYLMDSNNDFWVPTPFDHKVPCSTYSPFEEYSDEMVQTTHGQRRFPLCYNAKNGIADSWLCLNDKQVRDDLFEGVPQVGIDKQNIEQAFFKKEYKRLKKSFCFAFFAEVKENFELYQNIVYLGQGKSPFCVECYKDKEEPEFPKELLKSGIIYARSDIYYEGNIQELYNSCQFVCTKTRPHRIFKTNYLNRDGSNVVQLLKAGSIFWPNAECLKEDSATVFEKRIINSHAAIVGFNQIIIGGKEQ